jgi:hypothetical protein
MMEAGDNSQNMAQPSPKVIRPRKKMKIAATTSGSTMMIRSIMKATTRRANTPSNNSGLVCGS